MCNVPTVGDWAAVLNNAFEAFRFQSVTVSACALPGAASATTATRMTSNRQVFIFPSSRSTI